MAVHRTHGADDTAADRHGRGGHAPRVCDRRRSAKEDALAGAEETQGLSGTSTDRRSATPDQGAWSTFTWFFVAVEYVALKHVGVLLFRTTTRT
jgi:hypothetical protein